MAYHKRGKPKHGRAGCRLCKPHKSNKSKDREESQTLQERKARLSEREQTKTERR